VNNCFTLGSTLLNAAIRQLQAPHRILLTERYTRKYRRDCNVSARKCSLRNLTTHHSLYSDFSHNYKPPLSLELSLRNGGSCYQIPSPTTTLALAMAQLPKLGFCIQALPIKLSAQESNSAHAIDRLYIIFYFLFAFVTFNPCFTAWVCHGVFTVCFLLLIYITYALS